MKERMQPVPHDTILSVALQAQEWNQVLSLISDAQAPYRVTAPIIGKMQEQLVNQMQEADNVSQENSQ